MEFLNRHFVDAAAAHSIGIADGCTVIAIVMASNQSTIAGVLPPSAVSRLPSADSNDANVAEAMNGGPEKLFRPLTCYCYTLFNLDSMQISFHK